MPGPEFNAKAFENVDEKCPMLTVAFINVLWTIGKIASKYIPVKMKTQQSSLATDTVEKFFRNLYYFALFNRCILKQSPLQPF